MLQMEKASLVANNNATCVLKRQLGHDAIIDQSMTMRPCPVLLYYRRPAAVRDDVSVEKCIK